MNRRQKLYLLASLTVIAAVITFLFKPVSQRLSYHDFADKRRLWGIPNFANVVSNLPYIFVGFAGIVTLIRTKVPRSVFFMYGLLFLGVFLTGWGSGYYHYAPNNDTLVWDRIPMTIVFMSLFSATISEMINEQWGMRLLFPLLFVGIFSVWWWHYTELQQRGDLRLYGFVQFYPTLFIPFILMLFYDPAFKGSLQALGWAVIWYVAAKIFETYDQAIYNWVHISGHTLKHLASAVSTWYFIVLFQRKYVLHAL